MAVSVRTDPTFTVSTRRTILREPTRFAGVGFKQFDVHPDGDRFLMTRRLAADTAAARPRFTLVANWFEELKAATAPPASGRTRR